MPEIERIIELSKVFNVSTDYLLLSDEAEELISPTVRLETQPEALRKEIKKQQMKSEGILSSLYVYAIAFAVFAFLHLPHISNILDVDELRFAWLSFILLVATAIVIQINLRISKKYYHNKTDNYKNNDGSEVGNEENGN